MQLDDRPKICLSPNTNGKQFYKSTGRGETQIPDQEEGAPGNEKRLVRGVYCTRLLPKLYLA